MVGYLITAAQGSYNQEGEGRPTKVNDVLLKGLEKYCSVNETELIILPLPGKNITETEFHESVPEITYGELPLNSNVKISDMKVPPQNVDPATGRARFAQNEHTLIYPHSKQRFKVVPASNSKLPKMLLTTGVITTPNYNESNHRGDVARRDHNYGALVVEIIDDKFYNVRHIRSLVNGKFTDMGKRYNGSSRVVKAKTEALVIGDLHVGDTDESASAANYEMIDFFKPKRLVLHDTFNGHSVNYHERNRLMSRARIFQSGGLSLEKELEEYYTEMVNLSKSMNKRKVYIAKSNHDMFLNGYLQDGQFLKEPWNTDIGMQLSQAMLQGEDPLVAGMRLMGKIPKNLEFLTLSSDLKVGGYQLASHGHKGTSGSRNANVFARETAHGKSISGHSHTPESIRNTYIVGTSTRLNLPYTDGSASSWMHCNAVIYEGGQVQMLPIINGKWKTK